MNYNNMYLITLNQNNTGMSNLAIEELTSGNIELPKIKLDEDKKQYYFVAPVKNLTVNIICTYESFMKKQGYEYMGYCVENMTF